MHASIIVGKDIPTLSNARSFHEFLFITVDCYGIYDIQDSMHHYHRFGFDHLYR